MYTRRISVPINQEEARALLRMAQADQRDPRDQMRQILREAAQLRGMLLSEQIEGRPSCQEVSALREA